MAWYIKQLFPLTYFSHYKEDGKEYVSVWKMWFGRCYKHRKFEVNREIKVAPQE